jgi:formylglycine-generating enzyme required for sulfatase activity/tRNA A-37 threonylcarbamoyl transferase component Bud32
MTSDDADNGPNSGDDAAHGEGATVPSRKVTRADADAAPTSASPVDAANLVGTVLGGCRIDALLGRGAMGAVYKARQLNLDRDVAIKIVRPEMIADPRMLKRFQVEARTVGKFNSQHVVMVHDVGFDRDVHFLVMELVRGTNLRAHVKSLPGGRLPTEAALPLLRQAIKGLEEAKRLGVVHRDIKPDNLMLTEQGVLKIADFGIAKPAETDLSLTMTSELVGTPLYMSPEQCQGGADIDFRSDMYSLGATFFYLLSGVPPFRASSVYELIQTKTKLENLQLWTVRPELGEDHPMSRVISRMTANDRDDRYGNYPELLDDLAELEGDTKGTAPATRPLGRMLALVAAVLLVGAGAAWYAGRSAPVPPVPGADAAAALPRCRERLRDDGPSPLLRGDVAGLAAAADSPAAKDKALLLADIDAGLEVADRLAALARPTALALPFDDLRQHLAAVATARALPTTAGPEVRQWLERRASAAADATSLGALARAELLAAFTRWQDDRGKAGGDRPLLAALATRLDQIAASRATVLELCPSQADALDRDLPERALVEARQRLAQPLAPPTDADIGAPLAAIRAAFAKDGPQPSLEERARDLRPTDAAQVQALEQLLNDLGGARECLSQADTLPRPTAPKPPFDDVLGYYEELDRVLKPLQKDGALPPWAERRRAELRDEARLGDATTKACGALWAEWRAQRDAGAPTSELEARQRELKTALARGAAVFPNLAADLARAVPIAELDAQLAKARSDRLQRDWESRLATAKARLGGIDSLADWRTSAAELTAAAGALRGDLAELAADPTTKKRCADLEAELAKWEVAAKRFADAGARFADGDLTGGLAALRAGAGAAEQDFARLQQAIEACRKAFARIEADLDLAVVTQELKQARELVAALPLLPGAVAARVDEWLVAVEGLRRAAAGMVAIPAGTARLPAVHVPAFFLASSECSRGAWKQFQADLQAAATGATDADRFAAVAGRLAGARLDGAGLAELLRDAPTGADELPVDRVTWQEAMAYCRWHGKDLPTAAEWSLAAFGDGGLYAFPWGKEWTNDPQLRNPSTELLAPVATGGLSWRSATGGKLHHLGGNVAEWLQADPTAIDANLAGGRYNQGGRASAEEAAGGKLEQRPLDERLRGIGFRTVLRPRAYSALSWPR